MCAALLRGVAGGPDAVQARAARTAVLAVTVQAREVSGVQGGRQSGLRGVACGSAARVGAAGSPREGSGGVVLAQSEGLTGRRDEVCLLGLALREAEDDPHVLAGVDVAGGSHDGGLLLAVGVRRTDGLD